MVIFEGNVVKDAGNILCTSCYTLEGDRRKKRRKLNDTHKFDWKADPGEKACLIFE